MVKPGNKRADRGSVIRGRGTSGYDRRREQASLERKRILLFCLVALLLHLPLLELLTLPLRAGPEPAGEGPVEFTNVMLVSPADADRMREEQERRKLAEKEKEREKARKTEELKGQVVELGRVVDQRPPVEETSYLAQVDSRVEEETRKYGEGDSTPPIVSPPTPPVPAEPAETAHEGEAEPPAGPVGEERELARVQHPQPPVTPAGAPAHEPGEQEQAPPPPVEISPPTVVRLSEGLLTSDEQLKLDPVPLDPLATLRLTEPIGPDTITPPYGNLLPGLSHRTGSSGGTSDYLPDVKEGDATILNARQFTYWSFFQRIKDDVRAQWKPMVEYQRRDPTGQIHGTKDRVTVLKVMLKDDGYLMDAFVISESGLDFLDREALQAFQKAQPFPNPPEGLKDENGLVTFQFGFYLEINNRPMLRMFRPAR